MLAEDYSNLSDLTKQRLQMQEYIVAIGKIVNQHQLSYQQEMVLLNLIEELLLKKITISEIAERLNKELVLDDAKTKLVLLDFLGLMLWFQDELGDVAGLIEKNQGDKDKYYNKTATALVPENIYWNDFSYLFGEADIELATVTQDQKKSLFVIILKALQDKLEREQIADWLKRSLPEGGLGVSTEQAEQIALAVYSEIIGGTISLQLFEQLDELREKVLKEKFTSILDSASVEESWKTSSVASQLAKRISGFTDLPELQQIAQELGGFGQANYDEVKTKFYEAINSKNRLDFVSSLSLMFNSGRVKDLFKGDERYVKFWRNRILKDKGLEGVRKFDENPLRREQFGSFVRHVMEERFAMPAEDAVLWGVFFSSLAHRAGDMEYDRLAYGDLNDQRFKWNL